MRYIANRSSGRQGHAIAAAAAVLGARTTLIAGPSSEPDPNSVRVVHIETAGEMAAESVRALPADIAVCAAAVADWRAEAPAKQKVKKKGGVEAWSVVGCRLAGGGVKAWSVELSRFDRSQRRRLPESTCRGGVKPWSDGALWAVDGEKRRRLGF